MCGIAGYIGWRNALPVLIETLKKLEDKGYDSAGLAFRNGKGVEVYKAEGGMENLAWIFAPALPNARIGLAHAGWLEKGDESLHNGYLESFGGAAVAYNGAIKNCLELVSFFEGEEDECASSLQTIPLAFSHCLREGISPLKAIRKITSVLKGNYAMGIMCDTFPDTLFVVKSGCPLAVALGEGEYFFASDAADLPAYSKKLFFPENGQICVLRRDGFQAHEIISPEKLPGRYEVGDLEWSRAGVHGKGYDHLMLEEIHEQPMAVMDTIGEWLDDPEEMLNDIGIGDVVKHIRRLHIVGCGTSYHAGLVGRYIIEKFVRIPVITDMASEFRYMDPVVSKGTLFVALTESGETSDTVAALREAKEKGAHVFTICNTAGSTAATASDSVLYTRAGREVAEVSTKAFAAQLAALSLVGIALGIRKGKLSDLETETLKSVLVDLPNLIRKALSTEAKIRGIAEKLVDAKEIFYLGRGINYPIALEGALKMKEVAHIHAGGYPAGEMEHGPIVLVKQKTPVVVMAPLDGLYGKILSNIQEIKARGGTIVAVTDAFAALKDRVEEVIVTPPTHPALSPFVNIVPLQLLACQIGALKGHRADRPPTIIRQAAGH